jgi:flagellar protein FlbT
MPLKIELKPGEKFIVNGAVIVAGRTGASLALRNKAVLLRGRDVMQEEEATTPARRVYFALMLMYINPENRAEHAALFEAYRGEYAASTTLDQTRAKLDRIRDLAAADAFYPALKLCKDLIAFEDGLLAGTAPATRGEAA